MDKADLIRNLEHEYYSTLAANPSWDESLGQYLLRSNLISKDDIWELQPAVAADEGWDEPDWL